MSTTLVRNERDAWLANNRHRISRSNLKDIAIEMRKLGFYSKKAPIMAVYQSVHDACRRTGILN